MAEVVAAGCHLDVCRRCRALWLDRTEVRTLPAPVREEHVAAAETAALRRAVAVDVTAELARRENQGEGRELPEAWWKIALAVLGLPVELGRMATRHRPWATWALCALLLALGLLLQGDLSAAIRHWGFLPADAFRHGGLTWLSSFFIHAGWLHLLGNLWFLWLAGDNVEDVLGRQRFLILLLAATVAGHLAHLLWDPRSSLPCVGASGGISGVLAAYAILFPQARLGVAWWYGLLWLRLPAVVWFGFWLLGQGALVWLQVGGFGEVSALAHLGGVAAGVLLAWCWRQ